MIFIVNAVIIIIIYYLLIKQAKKMIIIIIILAFWKRISVLKIYDSGEFISH